MSIWKLAEKYKSIGLISSSLLVGAIITFIALPFLTRLYTVKDFGEYGVVLAIVSVLSTIANLRLDQALLVADDEHQKGLMFESSIFSLFFCIVSASILSFFFDVPMILAICTGIFFNTLIQGLYNYKFSHEAEFFCAGLNILRSFTVVLIQITLPLIMNVSLVISYSISSLFLICIILIYIVKYHLYEFSWNSTKNYKDFIFSNTPHALLNSFSHNLPYYIVSHFIGYQVVGFYSIVERTLRVPINLMSQTIRQFFIRKFKNQDSAYEAFKSSVILSLASLPLFAIFFIIPESLYLFVFGPEWIGISLYFKILALGYWAIFCNPPSSAFLIAKRKSFILFNLQIVELIVKISLFILAYQYFDHKIYMLLAIPISLIFYNFSILFMVWRSHE